MHETKLMRRVAGYHDVRLDGISDLVLRARGASVFDVGCNRGLIAFEFANNGARLVHGCDNYVAGIATAREVFCDLRNVESKFEVVDLTVPDIIMDTFGKGGYDIVLLLATWHKLKRVMSPEVGRDFIHDLGRRTQRYLGWRGNRREPEEIEQLDEYLLEVGLRRIQTSFIGGDDLGPSAIWKRA